MLKQFLKPRISEVDAQCAYEAAQKVVQTHRHLAGWLHHGVTLAQVDAEVARTLQRLGCESCFLKYRNGKLPPFPSHACLSVNECVVHGTAGYLARPMKAGDLLKIDIGVFHQGMVGDAGWTYCFGEPSPQIRQLMTVGKESLRRGVQQLRPGNNWLQWARTVQGFVEEENGFHLIRGLGGHGYGRKKLHAPPYVSNVVPSHPSEWPEGYMPCEPGTLVAVEPMIAIGTGEIRQSSKSWPVYTADGSMSVHYEHDVLVTENGPRVLSEGMDELPDVVTK